MTAKILLAILLFTAASLNYGVAQSVLKGTVTDQNQVTVPYATISLSGPDSAVVSTVQSDSAGKFVIDARVPGNYRLSVYSFGFAASTRDIGVRGDTVVQIVLRPLEGTLGELTVTGSKPVIEREADRTIYHVTNSISAAGSNGLEVLRQVPGIRINDKTISLAGRGALAIMVNRRVVHLSDKALLDYLKSFSSTGISRIEVITHPSAGYDAEGNAGIVNIVTKKSDKAGLSGNLEGALKKFFYKDQPDYKGIKNYGDLDEALGINYNKGKWSAYANVNNSTGREIWGYGIDVYYPDKHWAMKDTGEYRIATFNAVAGVDYALNARTTLGFEYNYVYHAEEGADYVRVPVYDNGGQVDSSLKTYATYYPVAKSNGFNVHLIRDLSQSGAKMTLNADYFNFYRFDRSNLITHGYTHDGIQKENDSRQLYDTTLQNIRIYTFKADLSVPSAFALFSFGSKVSFVNNYSDIYYFNIVDGERTLDSGLSNAFRYIENTQAVYGEASKESGRWKADAGLRAELTETKAFSYFQGNKLSTTYLKLFPSLLLSYKINDDHSLSLSYDKRIHRPTFWNLNPFKSFMTAYTYVEGNPYLEPEYITNVQLSHQYKNLLTSSLYVNVINNGFAQVIITHPDSAYIHTTTMLNFIRSYRYGISESLSFQPFPWWESSVQLNGYYTRVTSGLSYIQGIDGWGFFGETDNTFYFNRGKTLSGALAFWYQFPEVDHFGRSNSYYNLDMGLQWLALPRKLTIALNFSDVFKSSASKVFTVVNQIRNTYTDFQLNSQIRLSATWTFGNREYKRKAVSTGNEAERDRTN